VVSIKSERAKALILKPQAYCSKPLPQMRKFPGGDLNLWAYLEKDQQNVKKLSFSGDLKDYQQVLLEALSALLKGRQISLLDNLSLRECEAFLRDRNSEFAIENWPSEDDSRFKKIFQWLRAYPEVGDRFEYQFTSDKGPFHSLKLVDKVKELKAFLNSVEVHNLYKDCLRPELIDVEDLTVFIQAPYSSEQERSLFEELHLLGVATFQEEKLNFIPES
jgi:hypothetical protein